MKPLKACVIEVSICSHSGWHFTCSVVGASSYLSHAADVAKIC